MIFWSNMSYFNEGQLETDQDESILSEMSIILFLVLWEILWNGFPEQQHYQWILHVAEDPKPENALKRGWEKGKEVAEKGPSEGEKNSIINYHCMYSNQLLFASWFITHASFLQLLKAVKPLAIVLLTKFWLWSGLCWKFWNLNLGTFIWMNFQ